uniref:Phosphoribosyltransferase domain-containing protein n=1 Tax=Globisporangium ultimum (strain ATCC 200006 / CBS 805.95 / DAOM BR144) TaxID=431595 RepID=K3X231_GLOUD
MFLRAVRSHAKYGIALLGAPTALSYAHAEPRVYASGEALGRGVRLELWKAKHENVVVLDFESELIQLGITKIRDYENAGAQFVHDANSVLRAAVDLALTELPNDEEAVVTTPRGHKCEGVVFEDDVKVVGISIAKKPEVQKGLQQVLETTLPFESKLGEIIVADVGKGDFKIVKASLPDDLDGHEVLLLCPDLAAIEQISKTIHLLRQQGVDEEKITVVTLVTCPEAADSFCQTFGEARLVTAAFDATRDKEGYIVPGFGDFEERYLGGAATVVDLPEEAESESNDSDLSKKLTSWWPFGTKN